MAEIKEVRSLKQRRHFTVGKSNRLFLLTIQATSTPRFSFNTLVAIATFLGGFCVNFQGFLKNGKNRIPLFLVKNSEDIPI
jgi:hypothetical protein